MPRLSFASRLYSFVGNAVIGFPPADPRLEHMYLLPAERVRANGPLHEDSTEWLQERLESPYLMRQMTRRIGQLVSFYLMGIMVLGIALIMLLAPTAAKLAASRNLSDVKAQQADAVAQQQDQQTAQASDTARRQALLCEQTRKAIRDYPNTAPPLPAFCGAAGATPASTIPQYTNHE